MWLIILTWLASFAFVSALSDAEKKEKAVAVIHDNFHKADAGRHWTKEGDTDVYTRYECNTRYKAGGIYWHISVHVHPAHQKQFDRIYAFQYKGDGAAFMGARKGFGTWTAFNLVKSDSIARPSCKVFCHKYNFETDQKIVVITNFVKGSSLRTVLEDGVDVNFKGGLYEKSSWQVTLIKDGSKRWAKFKNVKSNKYLRFDSDSKIEGTGNSGTTDNAIFKVHKLSDAFYRLESKKFPGKFIRVTEDGEGVSVGGGGGDKSKFKIWRKD